MLLFWLSVAACLCALSTSNEQVTELEQVVAEDTVIVRMALHLSGAKSGTNKFCELGTPDMMSRVETIEDSKGECKANHGQLFFRSRLFYKLSVKNNSVTGFSYGCTDSSCKDCLTAETTRVAYGSCMSLGDNFSYYLQGDGNNCLGPRGHSKYDGISVIINNGCGYDVDTILSLQKPETNSGKCLVIEGLELTGSSRYYKFTTNSAGTTVSGKWMCLDEFCENCDMEIRDLPIGREGSPATCSNFMQVVESESLEMCQSECACAPSPPSPPMGKGFVYMNGYMVEDGTLFNCILGKRWQQVVVSKMKEGCHRYRHQPTQTDMYRLLNLNSDGSIRKLGLYCGPVCDDCENLYPNINFGECHTSQDERSFEVFQPDDYCRGSTNIELDNNGLSISYFTTPSCEMENMTEFDNKVMIRGYPAPSGRCVRDGITLEPMTYYKLEKSVVKGVPVYNGMLNCTSKYCNETTCQVIIKDVVQGQCVSVGGKHHHAVQILENEVLKRCEQRQPSTTTSSHGRKRIQPQSETDQLIISISVGAVLVLAAMVAAMYYIRAAQTRNQYQEIQGSRRRDKRRLNREQQILRQQRASMREGRYEYNGM